MLGMNGSYNIKNGLSLTHETSVAQITLIRELVAGEVKVNFTL
jgi:hypothetical protein